MIDDLLDRALVKLSAPARLHLVLAIRDGERMLLAIKLACRHAWCTLPVSAREPELEPFRH